MHDLFVQAATNGVVAAYYQQISVLTPKVEAVATTSGKVREDTFGQILTSPSFVLLLFGTFIFLLVAALLLQAVNKVLDYKRTIMTLMVCLMIVSVPLLLRNTLYSAFQLRAELQEEPRNIVLEQISPTALRITWQTQEAKIGSVRYSKAPLNLDSSAVEIGNAGKLVKDHQVVIERLEQNVEYEAEILSGAKWYDDRGTPLKFKLK